MSTAHRIRRSPASSSLELLTVCALLLCPATPAASQDPEDSDARMERIGTTYRLTEPVLKKYAAATRELLAAARKNPAIAQTPDSGQTAAPEVRAIYARHGLAQDELEKFTLAMAYAYMGNLGANMSGEAARELEQGPAVVRANVAFLKTHDATFKAVTADMKALQAIQEGKTEAAADAEPSREMRVTGGLRAGLNGEIEVEVTGGRHAGRHTAKVSEGGCSYGLTKKGAWGNQYSITTEDPKKFSSLQLIVPDGEAAAGGTPDFMLMVSFGSLLGGTHYKVETSDGRKSEGSGTVTVKDDGAGATITFDGKTKDGVALRGTIRCHSVMRLG